MLLMKEKPAGKHTAPGRETGGTSQEHTSQQGMWLHSTLYTWRVAHSEDPLVTSNSQEIAKIRDMSLPSLSSHLPVW